MEQQGEPLNMLAEFVKAPFAKFKGGEYYENEGIVEEILGRLCCLRRNQRCVEIGSPDGICIPNTFNLMKKYEMYVLSIETEFDPQTDIKEIAEEFRIDYVKTTADNIENVMEEHGIPEEFAVMSIDMNGLEYELFEKMKYKPYIVIVPVDPKIIPTETQQATVGVRASFKTMNDMARKKGYMPVAHSGTIVYVRQDLIKNLHIKGFQLRSTDHLFDWSVLNNA